MERRRFLGLAGATAGAVAAGAVGGRPAFAAGVAGDGYRAPGAGELPYPLLPEGTDTMPKVDHIVLVMMENHSFDNMLGTLGRGDGLTIGTDGKPTNSNPNGTGGTVRSFHLPNTCQGYDVTQSWNASHQQFDGGKCDGFVESPSGANAMGYFDVKDMPFTASLASVFPLADRWFCSVLGPTDPNRRFLLAGTSLGLITDALPTELPPHGTVLDQFHRHGITWKNYYSNLPSTGVWLGLINTSWWSEGLVKTADFFTDCAKGTLPQFSLVDPNFDTSSEENPQDTRYGDVFLSQVVNAVMSGPKWKSTLLLWNYDEHGGYYDHVPPPRAPKPDNVPPDLQPGDTHASFNRLGFRVPAGIVSPYAKKDHVSHTVYDHTSVLKLVHRKFNLPSLTARDHAANDVTDMLDFGGSPAFAKPPSLHRPANPHDGTACPNP